MFGLGHLGEFALGQESQNAAEIVTIDKWFANLSEPVRIKPGLRTSEQQFLAFASPKPVVPFGWFENLSEPVRVKRRLPTPSQPYFSFQPTPIINISWFAGLSEPVRQKRGLRPYLQRSFTADTDVIPTSKMIEWFAPLSQPVRQKKGLRSHLQQFLASPSRLLPTPTSFGTLSALETKDTFLAGAMLWNRATDAEIGVIGGPPQPAEIGLSPAQPTAGAIFAKISVRITPP